MATQASEIKVVVEAPRPTARRLTITVPAERVERTRQETTRRLAQQVRVRGFRRGKVPAQILERQYGAVIQQETIERVMRDAYREALEREDLHPITQGEVEKVDYEPGADLTFDIAFEVQPEVRLERLGGFRVERPAVEVTEEEVDRVVERLREQQAVWHPVEDGTALAGDLVTVEITPLEGEAAGQPRGYQIVLGEGHAVPDVEDAIRTLRPGEEGEFTVRTAEGAKTEGASGMTQRVRIKVREVRRPELPALDDEFAKSVGDFSGLEELRERIRQDLTREAEREAEREVRHRLMDQILAANPVDVPEAMVNRYLDDLLRPGRGADPERVAQMREIARPGAEQALKRMLVVARVAEMEGLHATEEEVESRIQEIASRQGRSPEEVRTRLQKTGQLAALEQEITEDKVFEYLKSLSTIE